MNPRIKDVKPLEKYKLKLFFTNGEIGIFKELQNFELSNSVQPFMRSIQWK